MLNPHNPQTANPDQDETCQCEICRSQDAPPSQAACSCPICRRTDDSSTGLDCQPRIAKAMLTVSEKILGAKP